jgi:hypothetical protein
MNAIVWHWAHIRAQVPASRRLLASAPLGYPPVTPVDCLALLLGTRLGRVAALLESNSTLSSAVVDHRLVVIVLWLYPLVDQRTASHLLCYTA